MLSIAKIFFFARGTKPWLVLSCLVLASFFEGVGIATLLPILAIATDEQAVVASPLYVGIHDTFAWLGIDPTLGPLLLLIVGAIIFKSTLGALAMTYVGYAMAEMATNLREQLMRGLLDVRWAYFTGEPVGRVANAMSVDATRAGMAYLAASRVFIYIINAIVLSLVAFVTSWRLALAALALGLLISTSLNVFMRMMRRAGRKQTERTQDLVAYLTDMLGNIKPLKAMNRQDPMAEVFSGKTLKLRTALRKQVISRFFLKHTQDVMAVICLATGFYVASVRFAVPVSELVVTGLLLLQVVRSFNHFQRQIQRAMQNESAYWNVKALIEEVMDAREVIGGEREPTFRDQIELRDVSFGFDGVEVLHQANMTIEKGGIVLMTGPSGAGKTTVTDLIMGLRLPNEGLIALDRHSLADMNIATWRRRIGYVPQESFILHDTVRANIALGDQTITDDKIWQALELAGARAFVDGLPEGLDSIVGEKGMRLSGGQRQRIAIARALAADPALLVLDEVTSNLDPNTESEICAAVARLRGQLTVLAVSHREAWLEIADKVYEVRSGKVTLGQDAETLSLGTPASAG